ncbi:MAG: nuclear transport factor 2 family protein [Planctomycetota bacterium]
MKNRLATLCLSCSAIVAGILYLTDTSSHAGAPPVQDAPQGATQSDASANLLEQKLSAILADQQDAWNDGDIDAFMSAYLPGESLTFSSRGKTQRGYEATKARYLKSYPDKAAMGKLQFSDLEVQALGNQHALMLGRWKLSKDEPAEGNFSLVWREVDGNWLIIHDHYSSTSE